MSRMIAGTLLILSICFLPGCGSDIAQAEAVSQEMIQKMNQMADLLEEIKDEKSLKATEPKLDTLLQDLKNLGQRSKNYKVTKSENERLTKELMAKLQVIKPRIQKAGTRIITIPGGIALLQKIETSMRNLGK